MRIHSPRGRIKINYFRVGGDLAALFVPLVFWLANTLVVLSSTAEDGEIEIFENIIPCAIITPLDCFWEGSKLLGPDYPVHIPVLGSKVRWTNLNPFKLIEQIKGFNFMFPFDTLEDFMKRRLTLKEQQHMPASTATLKDKRLYSFDLTSAISRVSFSSRRSAKDVSKTCDCTEANNTPDRIKRAEFVSIRTIWEMHFSQCRRIILFFRQIQIHLPKSTSVLFPWTRAGISNGYQGKPCLDPSDTECPETAPNKMSGQVPDIGAELTGGCYGFAAKYMHWPEDLIVGGTSKNKTGHLHSTRGKRQLQLMGRDNSNSWEETTPTPADESLAVKGGGVHQHNLAHALQTVIQLMGERELYDFWSETYKVHHLDWTQEKASLVLEMWQRRFAQEVRRQMNADNITGPYNVYAFSTSTLNDILTQFSELNIPKVVTCYIFMVIYAGVVLLRWYDPVRSQAGVGVAGVMLVSMTVAAGLGFCALLGIAFNASTTQIVPFLALGLGVDDMFLIVHTYAEEEATSVLCPHEQTGIVLKRTGLNVLLTALSNMCAFFAAAIIPVPALRVFSLQAAVLVMFNLAAVLLVFPAVVSLDLRRRRAGRIDLLCCCLPSPGGSWPCASRVTAAVPRKMARVVPEPPKKLQAITRALPPDRQQTVTVLASPPPATLLQTPECWVGSTRELLTLDLEKGRSSEFRPYDCLRWSLTRLATNHYAPLITKSPFKVITMIGLVTILAASIWGVTKVSDGLDLTDIVPQNTDEHAFLSAQGQYFGFYNIYAVTMGDFEYPTNQRLLYDYHEGFMRVPSVIKNDDGGLPDFWLSMFREWLIGLQKAFDRDWSRGSITQERWFQNASDEGILGYKLLVQTGHVDNPIDKSLVTQVRLVDTEGIINPKAFYNYLSAWASNDALAYGASQANFRPEPRPWFHAASDFELKIPKSAPLIYAQIPLYLHGLSNTERITRALGQVRALCRKFEERGLPNYPSGIPFLFWEQYLGLRQSLGLALLCALGAVFLVVSVLLLSLWAATLVVGALAAIVLQLLGLMGVLGIKLSAVPAVLLVVAVGIGVHFTLHICLGFVSSIGCRNRRISLALEHMFAPIMHGALTTLLGVFMLAFSEFDFIVSYFFSVLVTLVLIGLVNGLVFFPVLLSLIGPAAEVVPYDHPDRISTPSPPPSPVRTRVGSCRVSKVAPPRRGQCNRLHAEPSLTTITEEGNSWHSTHEIVVQPELVVETTTYGPTQKTSSESCPSSHTSTPPLSTQSHVTTKVTATAHVKVEVHTPLPGAVDREIGGGNSKSRSSRSSRDSGSESDHSGRHSS
uniref:SSD domain-containing protein n=1 Tax=Timema monikensis TaxID=170555 RepID=A0A7R9EBK5_9NEOP|nr:unnamed protein product [Timema monikensis]